jgi:hypothetical protein
MPCSVQFNNLREDLRIRHKTQSPVPQPQACYQDNQISMTNQNLPGLGSQIPGWAAGTDQAQMINNIFDSSMQARQ